MKMIFLTKEEVNKLAQSILNVNKENITCTVTFSEEEEMDVVEVYRSNEAVPYNSIALDDLLSKFSDELGVTISSFDVIEIDPYGIGFAFFF